MKKWMVLLILSAFWITGCASSNSSASITAESESSTISELTPVSGNSYENYHTAVKNAAQEDTWTAAVNSMYKMKFSDDTYDVYTMDGVLEKGSEVSHLTENFDSNGMNSTIDGYYYDGRLYNNYNNVTYYEDMTEDSLEQLLVTPLSAYAFLENQIDEINEFSDASDHKIFTIHLTEAAAEALFPDRYDIYGLSEYDDYEITSNRIVDTFDEDGRLVSEITEFDVNVSYSAEEVEIVFTSSMNMTKLGTTEVNISDTLKSEQAEYVAYSDIDTDAIETVTDDDDSAEKDAVTTFRKRLISRLDYTENDDGTLTAKYNDYEAYTIDLTNKTFMYSSYSINYIYSWNGDVAAMGDCTYTFATDQQSSSCTDETVERMKDVKEYLEMELYYCGLTLEDLQNNTSYEN